MVMCNWNGFAWRLGAGLLILAGCRAPSSKPAATVVSPPPLVAPAAARLAPDPGPAPEVVPTTYAEPAPAPSPAEALLPGTALVSPSRYPIDLPTALQLAHSGNYQVSYAREQIQQAWARADAASVRWLPSIRGGLSYNKHEGQIQDISGNVFPASRGNVWSGLGAAVPGAGSPAYPGISAHFHLADALFEPLAARQHAAAKQHASLSVTNDVLWRVALGYIELTRAAEEMAIAQLAVDEHRELFELTQAYANSGQGSPADADRARTELDLRTSEQLRAQEGNRVASTRLAQLIRLNVDVALDPLDPVIVPIDIVPRGVPVGELVSQGLAMRPELDEHRHLAAEAAEKMRRERYSILLPSLLLGASYGGFGGGQGSTIGNYGNRFDTDVMAYWQLRNLGLGDRAARDEAASVVRQTNVQQMAAMDQVAREVVEAHGQVEIRWQQIENAKNAVASATQSRQRNLERIKQGRGLPIEMLQANQALNQARREYLRTIADYNSAQFTLYRAIGAPGRFEDCGSLE